MLMAVLAFSANRQFEYIDRRDIFGRFTFGRSGTYGTVRLAKEKELEGIAKKEPIEKAWGTIFGQFTDNGEKVFDFMMGDGEHSNKLSNRNIMAIGATGAGKTFGFVTPYLLQAVKRRETVVIPDPSGEVYKRYTNFLRTQCGYKVHHLIFNLARKSDGWDILSVLRGDPEINAAIFSQVIFDANNDREDGHIKAARMLFESIYLYIMLNPDMNPRQKTWDKIIEIISQPTGWAYFDEIFTTANITKEQEPAQRLYYECKASENFSANILITLRSNLKVAQSSIMRTVLSTRDIDIYDAATNPTVIFCQFPEGNHIFTLLTSLFFALSFIALYEYADSMPDGKLPVHVNFLIDEAKAVGKIPDLDDKLVTLRKRNMSLCTIFQDISQFQKLYGMDTWNTLFGGSAVKMALGVQDDTTARFLSEFIGKSTATTRSEDKEAFEAPTKQARDAKEGETARAYLTPDEIRGLGDKEMILVLFAYKQPFILYRCYANAHPYYKMANQPFDIMQIPDLQDKQNRMMYHNWCENLFYESQQYFQKPDYSEVWKTKTWQDKIVNIRNDLSDLFRNASSRKGSKPKKRKDPAARKSKNQVKLNQYGIQSLMDGNDLRPRGFGQERSQNDFWGYQRVDQETGIPIITDSYNDFANAPEYQQTTPINEPKQPKRQASTSGKGNIPQWVQDAKNKMSEPQVDETGSAITANLKANEGTINNMEVQTQTEQPKEIRESVLPETKPERNLPIKQQTNKYAWEPYGQNRRRNTTNRPPK